MNISQLLAQHAVSTEAAGFDQWTLSRAKDRVLDSLGNIVIGRDAPGNAAATGVYGAEGGLPEATVIGRGKRTGAANAAALNALMQRSFDFEACGAEDSMQRLHAGHASGSTFPTAFAVGERQGASGADLLSALIVGDDIATRVTIASGFNLEIGTDNTGISNGFGCAATAGRLMGLDEKQMIDGFGLVLNQLAGTIENIFDGAMAFKLPQAMSARNAINSVDLAAAGFTGPHDPLGGRFGFFSLFGHATDTDALLHDLGEKFYGDKIIKPWSCCRLVQGPVEAATSIRERVDLDEIREVRVFAPQNVLQGFTAVPFVHGTSTLESALFNMAICVALGLEFGEVRPELLTDDVLASSRLRRLHDRVRLVELDSGHGKAMRLEVELNDGRIVAEAPATALGDIYANPLSREQLLDKYYRNMSEGGVEREVADQVRTLVEGLESVGNVRVFGDLLIGQPVRATDQPQLLTARP